MMNFLFAKIAFFGPSQCVSSIDYFYTGNHELDRSVAVTFFNKKSMFKLGSVKYRLY